MEYYYTELENIGYFIIYNNKWGDKHMIKFALCDDNSQILSKLKERLETIFFQRDFDAEVVFTTTNPTNLVDFISKNDVNVLFLDIDLNSQSTGIDIAKEIRKNNKSIYIIFLTGHFEYIVSAFECKTFDFIQKPFSFSRLESTIIRLFEDLNANEAKFIKLNNKNKLINQDLINFIQKDGMRAIYHLNSTKIASYGSFSKISISLPNNFVRCHKSYMVNMNNISNVDLTNNTIYFKHSSNIGCFIGPKYKNKFLEVLNNHGNIK